MDEHAQLEIRSYAKVIGHDIVSRWCPLAWEAFCDYGLGSLSLTKLDQSIIGRLAQGMFEEARSLAESYGWLGEGQHGLKRHREREECEAKLQTLGLPIPWIRTG